MRRCWVNFQCRGVLLIWIIVGQGPIALVVGAGGGCFDIFSLIYHSSFLSPSLWETVRYRLEYCPKTTNQPTLAHNTEYEECICYVKCTLALINTCYTVIKLSLRMYAPHVFCFLRRFCTAQRAIARACTGYLSFHILASEKR